MTHPLQCRCATVRGLVAQTHRANHAVCYCQDCQAFAHFLGRAGDILDARGGSTVIQTRPQYVTFSQGAEALACMRLSDKGMLRWYAGCCNTPIGNTLGTFKLSFIGLLHSCLLSAPVSGLDSFGPVRARVNTQGAIGYPKPTPQGMAGTLWWFLASITKARIDGSYKNTAFFNPNTGAPTVAPRVLGREERSRLRSAVAAAARD